MPLHLSACVPSRVSVRRSLIILGVLACLAIAWSANAQTQEAALNIPDGILSNAASSLRSDESGRPEKLVLPDAASSLRLFSDTLSAHAASAIRSGKFFNRSEFGAEPVTLSSITQFATVKPVSAVHSLAVAYETSSLFSAHRAKGPWRGTADWIVQETLGKDGVREMKQGLDVAKRIAFRKQPQRQTF